jgi:hypothetical protein
MNDTIQTRMLNAVYACMLPLAKLLLRSGITYKQFELVAKRAFVLEATTDPEGRGRATNTSRVAVKTGLARKDVKRIRDTLAAERVSGASLSTDQSGPPARVLHAWHSDRRFVGDDGKPRDLDFLDETDGFFGLVRAVAGDVPPGAVRAELKHAGAVTDLEDGKVRVVKRFYVPGNVGEKAITAMSGMVFPLVSGVVHNTDPTRNSEGFIQRFAYSESLDAVSVSAFRERSREEATRFIEQMDDWLAEREFADRQNSTRDSIENRTVGIGVFYYEGPSAGDAINEKTEPS